MQHQLTAMLDLQDKMNTKVHPEWRTQRYHFYRAAWIECAELMDHYGYKWWKKQNLDMNQVHLEIVDIWHFILSKFLMETDSPVKDYSNFEFNDEGVLDNAERLAYLLLNQSETNENIFEAFLNLMNSADMDFDDLFRMYIGKNVLNFFRQDHGYKQGTYIKIWNGREDNEHLTEIMDSLDSTKSSFSEDIYSRLELVYSKQK